MNKFIGVLTVLVLVIAVQGIEDEFCVEKRNLGEPVGRIYRVRETCGLCACDGGMRMFCAPDKECRDEKQAEHDQVHRRPCYMEGNKHAHGSKVQTDCNICTCNNSVMECTDQDCDYSLFGSQSEVVRTPDCEDEDKRCARWVEKRGSEYCQSNNYVKKKCSKSCDTCPGAGLGAEEEDIPQVEVCENTNANCESWAERTELCSTHKFVQKNCRLACGLCTVGGEEEVQEEEEVVQEEERELTEEERIEEEWRQRLIDSGVIAAEGFVAGCRSQCEGSVTKWGSVLQSKSCGTCYCKRTSKTHYFFECEVEECNRNMNPSC